MSNSIANFLSKSGVSLEPYGSAEVGLRPDRALQLLELLHEQQIPIHGIEEWRHKDGAYTIESLGGWYSEGQDLQANYISAKQFIRETVMAPQDVLTVQFEGMASYGAIGGKVGA